MINLIPNEERKKMIRDFYLRLVVMFLLSLGFSFLITSVSILPSYFMSSVKVNLVNNKLETQSNDPLPAVGQKTLDVVRGLNAKLDIITQAQNNKFIISQNVINGIVLAKMPDIKITEIVYEDNTQKGKKVGVSGTAPSRERLLLFRQALEDEESFSQVDLPISNFVKESNIKFYLTLIPS